MNFGTFHCIALLTVDWIFYFFRIGIERIESNWCYGLTQVECRMHCLLYLCLYFIFYTFFAIIQYVSERKRKDVEMCVKKNKYIFSISRFFYFSVLFRCSECNAVFLGTGGVFSYENILLDTLYYLVLSIVLLMYVPAFRSFFFFLLLTFRFELFFFYISYAFLFFLSVTLAVWS